MGNSVSNKFVRIGDMALLFRYANDGWTTFLSNEQMEEILAESRKDQVMLQQLRAIRASVIGGGDV